MTAFKMTRFSGLIPRTPPSLLPETNSVAANNCDFAYGELRNVKDDLLVRTMSNTAKSVYTDDGTQFYSWNEDINAVRSPLSNDTFNRLYYTTPTDFRVTGRAGMSTTGGAPALSYRVGVPRQPSGPFYGNPTITHHFSLTDTVENTFWYELNGIKYQPTVLSLTRWGTNDYWSFMLPNRTGDTPEEAYPAMMLTVTHDGGGGGITTVTKMVTSNSSFEWIAGRSLGNGMLNLFWIGIPGSIANVQRTIEYAGADAVTRAYVCTQVNIYNEESRPSSPMTLIMSPSVATELYINYVPDYTGYAPIKEVRIYRTPDGSSIADYFYVGSISMLGASNGWLSFIDNVASSNLNEPLASHNYYAPNPLLVGLMALPNGILMAWKGNELHFSDAYKPWSWPPAYVKTFGDYDIVGAIAVGSGAMVTTTGKPYMIAGVTPDSMTDAALNIQQAGVSKWAMADIGGQIVYASHDGIVAFDGGMPSMALSNNYFTRDVWRERYGAGLSTMRFSVWDGRLIVYSSLNNFTPFLINLDEARGAMTDLQTLEAQCSFVSPKDDQCYLVLNGNFYRFMGGANIQCVWKSRDIIMDKPLNFGVAQVVCSGYWGIRFFADGQFRHVQGVTGNETFRLPSGFLAERWSIEISGTGIFKELRVGETATDLKAL